MTGRMGWLKSIPSVCDISPVDLKLYGLKFVSSKPVCRILRRRRHRSHRAIPAFQHQRSDAHQQGDEWPGEQLRLLDQPHRRRSDARIASGIRLPRGLGFTESGAGPYATNDGMEMRGTRPIKDDPDAFIKVGDDAWFGFPDFSTVSCRSPTSAIPAPGVAAEQTGYPDGIRWWIDDASNLPRKLLLPTAYDQLKGRLPADVGRGQV